MVAGVAVVGLAACGRAGAGAAPAPSGIAPGIPLNDAGRRWVEQSLASLSLRDRVAQLVMVWVLGDYTSTTDSSFVQARNWVADDHVGGVVMSLGTPIEVAAKVNDLQRAAQLPLLVASDLEPGLGRLEGGSYPTGAYPAGSADRKSTRLNSSH